MADRKRPNTYNGPSTVNRLAELERRFRQRTDMPSAPEAEILERIGEQNEAMERLRSSGVNGAELAQDIASGQQAIEKLYSRLDPLEERRINTATKGYISAATTAVRGSNLFRDVNAVAGGAAAMGAASAMVGTPTHELERMRAQSAGQMLASGNRIVDLLTESPDNPAIKGMTNSLGAQINSTAQAQAALDLQRRMGMDISSRFRGSREAYGNLNAIMSGRELTANVRSGSMGTREDVENTLRSDMDTIGRFQKAQERYAGDPEKFERFQKAIDKLTGSAEKAAATLREMERQGSGLGGIAGFLNNPKVRGGMEVAQAAGQFGMQLMDTWTFQNPLRERQNQIAYANIGNRQFDDQLGALGGDMSALRRLGGAYGAAQDANQTGKAGSKVSSGFGLISSLAGAGLGAGAGMAAAAAAGTGVGIPLALGILAGAGAVNYFAGNFNQQAGERGSALAEAELRKQDALNKINDYTTQSFVDYNKSIGAATVGMGGLRMAGFEQMTSSPMLQRMAGVGINSQAAAQLTGMGVANLGRDFNPNQVVRAGELRQGGYMNEQQYMQGLGQMSMVGGNAGGNMEEILKNAVANGMDNAKSIAQMVQATTTLASKSASAGIDTLSGSTQVIGKIMDTLEDQGVPINMRGAAAAQSAGFANQSLGDRGLNLNTITRFQEMAGQFKGASGSQLRRLSTLTSEEIASLGGANGADYAKQIGLDNLLLDQNGKVDMEKLNKGIERPAFEKIVNEIMPRGLSESSRKKFIKAGSFQEVEAAAGRGDISEQEMRDFRAQASDLGINLGGTLSTVGGGGARKGTVGTSTAGGAGQTDVMRQQQAEGERKVLEQGREVIDALGGLKGLTEALSSVAKNFNPKEMSEAVKKGADSFNVPVIKFGEAVDKFSTAISDMGMSKK